MADNAPQSAKSHARWQPMFHFFALPVLLANFIVAIVALVKSPGLDSGFAALVAFALVAIGLFSRTNALAAQDRVIRLEERLRMRELLPADMHDKIEGFTAEQMVGLRFASDGEYVELVRAVLAEGINDRAEIKKRVKTWRPDYQRV